MIKYFNNLYKSFNEGADMEDIFSLDGLCSGQLNTRKCSDVSADNCGMQKYIYSPEINQYENCYIDNNGSCQVL